MPTGIYVRTKPAWNKGLTGKDSPHWKNGIIKHNGYVYIHSPNHPFAHTNNYVKRSRIIMEQKLGRYLTPKEIVHHINGIKDDDRSENLKLLAKEKHSALHNKHRRCHFCGRLLKKDKICHSLKKVNRHYKLYGKSIKELMKEFNLGKSTIWKRLNKNIPLSTPKWKM